MKNTSGSLNVLFLKKLFFFKCWRAIELTCFKGEGVNKHERIGFVAVLYLTIIGNAEATVLVLRIINQKKASQEIREILKNSQAPPPASKQASIPYGKCVMSCHTLGILMFWQNLSLSKCKYFIVQEENIH